MRVLVCWELGSGMGHVRRLAPIIHAIGERGHQVIVAARDVVSATRAIGEDQKVPVIAAPANVGASPTLPPSESYPEVLLRVGYADSDILEGLIRAWGHLFRLSGTDAVIAEHAPTALLAAHAHGLPAVSVGTGFSVPPPLSPMPPLPNFNPASRERILASEQLATEQINKALRHLNHAPLERIADLFPRERSFICSYRELDHHGVRPQTRYWGAIEPSSTGGGKPDWPPGHGPRVFVYLHHRYRQFTGLIQQLQAGGYPTLVVSPGIPADLQGNIDGKTIQVLRDPLDLEWMSRQSPVVITHCGHGTAARLLLLGTPMILLPNYVEQTVLAYRLAHQGLAVMMNPDPSKHRYSAAIERLRGDSTVAQRVRAFAKHYAGNDQITNTGALVDRILAALHPSRDWPAPAKAS